MASRRRTAPVGGAGADTGTTTGAGAGDGRETTGAGAGEASAASSAGHQRPRTAPQTAMRAGVASLVPMNSRHFRRTVSPKRGRSWMIVATTGSARR
ncbi:hypothetical protein EBZ80_19875 [bacterium]|nr:hypothetical protein [bacterium]